MKFNLQKWFYIAWTIMLLVLGKDKMDYTATTLVFVIAGGFICIIDSF